MKEVRRLLLNKSETEALFRAKVLLGRMNMYAFTGEFSKEVKHCIDQASDYVGRVLNQCGLPIDMNEGDIKFEEDKDA